MINLADVRELAGNITEDFRSTPGERSLANMLMERALMSEDVAAKDGAVEDLKALLADIDRRGHHQHSASSTSGAVHDDFYWSKLGAPLLETEKRWEKRAGRQFWFAAAMPPTLVLIIVAVAIFLPRDGLTWGILSSLVAVALSYSYIVLRVHQQTSFAEERMAEKRAGLAFLQIALERYSGKPEFDFLIKEGTRMFLGHHAADTVPLGPQDLLAARRGESATTAGRAQRGPKKRPLKETPLL